MTNEEKELLLKIAQTKDSFSENNAKADSISDEESIVQIKKGIELLSFIADSMDRKGTPGIFKKWFKRLIYKLRVAVADWLDEVEAEIRPE